MEETIQSLIMIPYCDIVITIARFFPLLTKQMQFMVYLVDLRHFLFCGWVLFLLFISFHFVLTYCFFFMCVLNIKNVGDIKVLLLSVSSILVLHISIFFSYFNYFLGNRMLVLLFCSNFCYPHIYNILSIVMYFLAYHLISNSDTRLKESKFWLACQCRKDVSLKIYNMQILKTISLYSLIT